MNYECINVAQWIKLNVSTKGSREKQWVLKPLKYPHANVELYLFKESNLSDTRQTLMKNIICMRRDLLRQEFHL